jgi:putative thymidine phosphorylase
MLLKVKSLNLSTGRPVAILHKRTARSLAIYAGDRIRIKNRHTIVAIVDLARGILKENQIALSEEVLTALNISEGYAVEISVEPPPKTTSYIIEKLHGKELDFEKLFALVGDIVHNTLTEAEIAYFVSGVYIHGMTDKEIANLTKAMVLFGKKLNIKGEIYDKHGVGGVAGNRTTPLIVAICAAAGVKMPKTSSRAITSAAGTADTVETLAKVEFSVDEIKRIVEKTNGCMVWGGALGLAPADDKIIQVERLLSLDPEAQLIASILAKKISVCPKGVLLDISYGKSAKAKTKADAEKLARRFEKISRMLRLHIKAIVTDGSQPVGNGIGPSLEMIDILKILKQEKDRPLDLEKKSVYMASLILGMAGKKNPEIIAKEILKSGKAYEKFKEIIEAQGGKIKVLEPAKFSFPVKAAKKGKVVEIDNRKISAVARSAGCPADKASGIYLNVHLNDKVVKNQLLMTVYAETADKLKFAKEIYSRMQPLMIK